ncbi:hypothetical protein PLESTM_001704000 [Pleodorina starrii]|nr:hypothetical protein PLESTM_001704000 [Pleodorina starrii]
MQQLLAYHFPLQGSGPDLETRMVVTCVVLCFTGLLRYDDLAKILVHQDLLDVQLGSHASIYLYRSKTDQGAQGATVTIGAVGELHPAHCPVQLLHDLLVAGGYQRAPRKAYVAGKLQEVEDVGPLLRPVARSADGSQRLAQRTAPLDAPIAVMPYRDFREKLNAAFQAAGIHRDFGTHAFRRGGATTAVNSGADRALVQKLGRWASPATFEKHYVKDGVSAHKKLTAHILGPPK